MTLDSEIDELVRRLVRLEKEIEAKMEAQQARFQFSMAEGRAVFEDEVLRRHKRLKTGLLTFLRRSPIANILVSPFIYGLVVPILILDLGVSIYQAVCFTVWRIQPVRRADYMVNDRHRLPYLNLIEKLNCLYCGYANGVIAYTREVASRTEQYWCPIKHALRVRSPHPRYPGFLAYGDTRDFRNRLQAMRKASMHPPDPE